MVEKEAPQVRAALDGVLEGGAGTTALVLHAEEGVHKVVLEALATRGLSVPGDLSVIAGVPTFDTSDFDPPLDAIPLVPTDSCTRAVELAVQQLDGAIDPRVELLAPKYRDHGSVEAPRPGS